MAPKRSQSRGPGGKFSSQPPEDLPTVQMKTRSKSSKCQDSQPNGPDPTSIGATMSRRPPPSKAASETDMFEIADSLIKMRKQTIPLSAISEEDDVIAEMGGEWTCFDHSQLTPISNDLASMTQKTKGEKSSKSDRQGHSMFSF